MNLSKYRKAMVAAAGVCGTAATVLADGELSITDGLAIVLAVLAAFGVYRVPNKVES